jgi:hypothetical protein
MPFLGIPTSRQDLGNNGIAKGATTTGLRLLANGNSLLGDPNSATRARTLADNIDNPAVNYRGIANPINQAPLNAAGANTSTPPPTQDTPPQFGGGGSASGTGAGASAADLALYDAGIGSANTGLGLLDQQQNIGFGNIGSSYNSALSTLLGSKNAAQGQYDTTRTRAQQDNLDARSQIDASVGRNANALQRLLGSRGAGNSSAAQVAAPYAAALQGTQQRMGVEKDYSRNMQDLDTNYNTFNTQWGQSKDDLDQKRFQQDQALKADVATKRSTLLNSLATLNAQKTAARGGSSASALASAQPYLNQVNDLQGQITNLGQQYANPIAVNAPQYTAPELAQYQYDTALNADPGNTSALTDTISPNFAALVGLNRRKDQQSIGY